MLLHEGIGFTQSVVSPMVTSRYLPAIVAGQEMDGKKMCGCFGVQVWGTILNSVFNRANASKF
jgi:hypothetical protein